MTRRLSCTFNFKARGGEEGTQMRSIGGGQMMKMNKMKKLASSLCFVLLLGVLLNDASQILSAKESTERYSEFWENPGEYDVWFLGTSHMYNAIHPMELWDKYGIRSYNLGASSSCMPQTYWTLMCALEYSKPKVIVLDAYKVHLDKKYQNQQLIHLGMDSIPFSGVKIKGICDLFDNWNERFEHICGFSVYHNRWEGLAERDFNWQRSSMKGASLNNNIEDKSKYQIIDKAVKMDDMDVVGLVYFKKILEECKEREINVVLTAIPFCSNRKQQRAMNVIPEIAKKYDVPYLNMIYEDMMDYDIDFADDNHANLFGAKKITLYIGDYLTGHYNLMDYRDSGEISKQWNKDYERYLNEKLERMRGSTELRLYVQWLLDERYTCYLYRKEEPEGLLAKEFAQLDNITLISEEEAGARLGDEIKGDYAFFVENENGQVVDTAVFQNGQRQS